jgi:hypothetical protein
MTRACAAQHRFSLCHVFTPNAESLQGRPSHAHTPTRPHARPGPQVRRVLPGPAGKLQALEAAGRLESCTPEALGLSGGGGDEVRGRGRSAADGGSWQAGAGMHAAPLQPLG